MIPGTRKNAGRFASAPTSQPHFHVRDERLNFHSGARALFSRAGTGERCFDLLCATYSSSHVSSIFRCMHLDIWPHVVVPLFYRVALGLTLRFFFLRPCLAEANASYVLIE